MNKNMLISRVINAIRSFLLSLPRYLKECGIKIYSKLLKYSFWMRILIVLGVIFSAGLIISLLFLIFSGTLANLLSTISFGMLLFVDVMVTILFYYDLNTKSGLEFFINEFNSVCKTFSRITEKRDMNVPMFIMLGDENSGKCTLLENSNVHFLKPETEGESPIKTFFNKKMLLWKYDLPKSKSEQPRQEQENKDDDATEISKTNTSINNDFETFLKFLKTRKNLLNLNGIILTIAVEDILNSKRGYLAARAKDYSEIINNIQLKLGISVPFHVMITKSDKICGFNEFFRNLDSKYYGQTFGWINSGNNLGEQFNTEEADKQITKILDHIEEQRTDFLHKFIAESAKDEFYETSAYFAFSENINNVFKKIKNFAASLANEVYATSKLSEDKYNLVPLFVRSICLTSSKQENDFFDQLYFEQSDEEAELHRKAEFNAPGISLFVKEFFEKILYNDTNLSARLTSLRRTYRWTRISGISLIFGSFVMLFLLTTFYWSGVFNDMTVDKVCLNSSQRYHHSKLLYPTLGAELSIARDNYLQLKEDFTQLRNNIDKTNKQMVDTSIPTLNLPYTKLNSYKVKPQFTPGYFKGIVNEWKDINKIMDNNVKVINKDELLDGYSLARMKYTSYLHQYYSYWLEVINNMSSPTEIPWKELKQNNYQYWQIANNFKTVQKIANKAFSTYRAYAGNSKSADNADIDGILKGLSSQSSAADSSPVRDKALMVMNYWNKVFMAKTPLEARNIIFNTKANVLYQRAIFKYMQKNERPNYQQKYWEQLSLMFFNSLKTAVDANAADYIKTLINGDKFPIVTKWQQGNDMSVDELKNIEKQLNVYWPSKDSYSSDRIGNSSSCYNADFDDAIAELRPKLAGSLNSKADGLRKLIKNILPQNNGNNVVKVYLLPPEQQESNYLGADYWTIMRMIQDKSDQKTAPVRTRIDSPAYLGELTYPLTGPVQFNFFRTMADMKSYTPNESLKVNGTWGDLRLLFNGPGRPQSYKGEYWVTWQKAARVNGNTWISKISFIDKEANTISFYIKLVFSTDISSIAMI